MAQAFSQLWPRLANGEVNVIEDPHATFIFEGKSLTRVATVIARLHDCWIDSLNPEGKLLVPMHGVDVSPAVMADSIMAIHKHSLQGACAAVVRPTLSCRYS